MPFLKVDKGLEAESDGVSLMKPIPGLDTLLARAVKLGVFGTKMRSTINLASPDAASRRSSRSSSRSAHRSPSTGWCRFSSRRCRSKAPTSRAEAILLEDLTQHLDALPADRKVMLKLTIPDVPDLYAPLIATSGSPASSPCRAAIRVPMPASAWPPTTG